MFVRSPYSWCGSCRMFLRVLVAILTIRRYGLIECYDIHGEKRFFSWSVHWRWLVAATIEVLTLGKWSIR